MKSSKISLVIGLRQVGSMITEIFMCKGHMLPFTTNKERNVNLLIGFCLNQVENNNHHKNFSDCVYVSVEFIKTKFGMKTINELLESHFVDYFSIVHKGNSLDSHACSAFKPTKKAWDLFHEKGDMIHYEVLTDKAFEKYKNRKLVRDAIAVTSKIKEIASITGLSERTIKRIKGELGLKNVKNEKNYELVSNAIKSYKQKIQNLYLSIQN